MPPLEAAIAGNKVIGYTGGGGKEYWNKPIFEEIQSGDIGDSIVGCLYSGRMLVK